MKKFLIAALALCVFSDVTIAQNHGFFVNANVGYGYVWTPATLGNQLNPIFNTAYEEENGIPPNIVSNSALMLGDFAWNADAGYQFCSYFALEGGYISFGQSLQTWNDLPANPDISSSDTVSLTDAYAGFEADAKGILPLDHNRFDLFGKAGAVDMHDEATADINNPNALPFGNLNNTQSAWVPLLGAGFDFNVNTHFALQLQDIYAFSSHAIPDANAILAGAAYLL